MSPSRSFSCTQVHFFPIFTLFCKQAMFNQIPSITMYLKIIFYTLINRQKSKDIFFLLLLGRLSSLLFSLSISPAFQLKSCGACYDWRGMIYMIIIDERTTLLSRPNEPTCIWSTRSPQSRWNYLVYTSPARTGRLNIQLRLKTATKGKDKEKLVWGLDSLPKSCTNFDWWLMFRGGHEHTT